MPTAAGWIGASHSHCCKHSTTQQDLPHCRCSGCGCALGLVLSPSQQRTSSGSGLLETAATSRDTVAWLMPGSQCWAGVGATPATPPRALKLHCDELGCWEWRPMQAAGTIQADTVNAVPMLSSVDTHGPDAGPVVPHTVRRVHTSPMGGFPTALACSHPLSSCALRCSLPL